MVRWIRLFHHQYLGFWGLGLFLFALQEIPYMIMPLLHLSSNPIMNLPEKALFLDRCEKLLGSLCIVLMTFVVHENAVFLSLSNIREQIFFTIAVTILLANYFGWFLYFTGHQSTLVVMLFIVSLPPLYYIFIGFWRQNISLTVCGALFFAVHFTHMFKNMKA